ncbi:hypothetical protein ACSBR2_033203 [Camellia fascicularis]
MPNNLRCFGRNLSLYLTEIKAFEKRTRACYSDNVLMSSHDFNDAMVDPNSYQDLLKLENQLPFFVLESLFTWSKSNEDAKDDDLPTLMLKVFDLSFPRPSETIPRCNNMEIKHLLHLFYLSLLLSNQATNFQDLKDYYSSNMSIQCVTQLRPLGIKFKSKKAKSFLDIKFKNQVLEIPTIIIDDFTSTLSINCVTLEQCQEDNFKYFTDYVSFMNCLLKQPRDVSFLCLDGIITRFSQDDLFMANLFGNLGKNVAFNIRNCSL